MDFSNRFSDIAKKYNCNYQYQVFDNCYGGHWLVYTYSIYNDSGCFTVHYLPQRLEVSFYYAAKFSNKLEMLCEKAVNVYEIEKNIWAKHEKMWIFKKPFFYWSFDKIMKALLEVIETSILKNNEFAGIIITNLD